MKVVLEETTTFLFGWALGCYFKRLHPLTCQGSVPTSNIYYLSDFIEEEREGGKEKIGKTEGKKAVGIRYQ